MPKIAISPAQGLLILMDHYKTDPTKVDILKKLYLCGADTDDSYLKIVDFLSDPVLYPYKVLYDADTINEDPTRRYFETYLAYQSLNSGLADISKGDLDSYYQKLYSLFGKFKDSILSLNNSFVPDIFQMVDSVLEGTYVPSKDDEDNFPVEFSDYITKIKKGEILPKLSDEDKTKMQLLIQCGFLGVINAIFIDLRLDIYGQGIYSEENRGKAQKLDQETTRNQNLGLMKGHMPLPLDDVARRKEALTYLKPSDQSSYIKGSAWVKSNFDKLVHPFSNSISGTILAQLRNHAELLQKNQGILTDSAEKMEHYFKLFISALILHSGGHSLNEYLAPFLLPEVQKEFSSIPKFSEINLQSMYLTHNKEAFDTALGDAIKYNKSILLRKALHTEVISYVAKKPETEKGSIIRESYELRNKISELKDKYAEQVKNQWFSSRRPGRLIHAGLSEAIRKLSEGDLDGAQKEVSLLKRKIKSRFGEKNFWGKKSESYMLVESLVHELDSIKSKLPEPKSQYMRDALSGIKAKNNQSAPKDKLVELDEIQFTLIDPNRSVEKK